MEGNYFCHDGGYVRPYYLIRFHVVEGLLRGGESPPVEPHPLAADPPVGRQKGLYPESVSKQRDLGGTQLILHE